MSLLSDVVALIYGRNIPDLNSANLAVFSGEVAGLADPVFINTVSPGAMLVVSHLGTPTLMVSPGTVNVMGSLSLSGALSMASLTVTGNATIDGNLDVLGTETVGMTTDLLGQLTVDMPLGFVGNIAQFQINGTNVSHIDQTGAYTVGASTTYADGVITTSGTLLSTNATLQGLSNISIATAGTKNILTAFNDVAGGVPILFRFGGKNFIQLGDGTLIQGLQVTTNGNGFTFSDSTVGKLLASNGTGQLLTQSNMLDGGGGAGTARIAGLLTASAGLTLTGILGGTYTLGGIPSLGASILPTADATWSLGSSALRINEMILAGAAGLLLYGAASDANPTAQLVGNSAGNIGLQLGPGGATLLDTNWIRKGIGIIGGASIFTSGGGTAPVAFVPGATGVATVVSATNNVVLICTAAGTQSADGAINGVSIGADWVAGQTVSLKANDTITWTGTVAPTFLTMAA